MQSTGPLRETLGAIFWLKLGGILLTGTLGILGVLTEFKGKEKKPLTRWGTIALIAIAISTVGTLIVQVHESRQEVEKANTEKEHAQELVSRTNILIERSNSILRGVDKSLNPLINVRAEYWLTVPLDVPEFKDYRGRLEAGIQQLLPLFQKNPSRTIQFASVSKRDPNGQIRTIALGPKSPLMPTRNETVPYYVIYGAGLVFEFYKQKLDETKLFPRERFAQIAIVPFGKYEPEPTADLTFSMLVDSTENDPDAFQLEFDPNSHSLEIWARNLRSDPKYWSSNNEIRSVPDLGDTRLIIRIDDSSTLYLSAKGDLDNTGKVISRIRSEMNLTTLILHIDTRAYLFQNYKMKHLTKTGGDGRSFALYTTMIPSNPDGLMLAR